MTEQAAPRRVQLSRRKGWRMPPDTLCVARPSKWGNPYRIGGKKMHVDGLIHAVPNAATAVRLYREWVEHFLPLYPDMLEALRGKNLACWCAIGSPCHADVLLEIANR